MVGCSAVVRNIRVGTVKIFNINPELVEIIGNTKREKLIVVLVELKVVGKGKSRTPFLGLPVAIIV